LWRPAPVVVTITWDDLWVGVKCQPNLEIAGSPRKVYRDRLVEKLSRGKALDGASRETEMSQSNSEYDSEKLQETDMAG
jgi:hypothetical protein